MLQNSKREDSVLLLGWLIKSIELYRLSQPLKCYKTRKCR